MKTFKVSSSRLLPILTIILILATVSCNKLPEALKPDVESVESTKIFDPEEAKAAYTSLVNDQDKLRQSANAKSKAVVNKILDWSLPVPRKFDGKIKFIIPFHLENEIFLKQADGSVAKYSDVTYFLAYLNNEKYEFEVVTKKPDLAYFKSKDKTKFSGEVIVEDVLGKFIKGYAFHGDQSYSLTEPQGSIPGARPALYCETIDWFSCASGDGGVTWYCDPNPISTTTHCYGGGSGTSTGGGGEGYTGADPLSFSNIPSNSGWSASAPTQEVGLMCAPATVYLNNGYYYAELSQVGFTAIHSSSNDYVDYNKTMCFKIKAYNLSGAQAGKKISTAVNAARILIQADLNSQYGSTLTNVEKLQVKIRFENYLSDMIPLAVSGSSVSFTNCPGNVPTEEARYQCIIGN